MKLVLATGNPGKVADFGALLPGVEVEWLPGYASLPSVEETGGSFTANARLKAEHYSRFTPELLLADDSGLEVAALGGAPGIYSARFSGRHGDDSANNQLLLERLAGVPAAQRQARFVCVLALARNGATLATFSGTADGHVLEAARGSLGFGYDPLFYSDAAGCSFGELTPSGKAAFSHRARATEALLQWAGWLPR